MSDHTIRKATIGQVARKKKLREYSMEELAMRVRAVEKRSGVAFASHVDAPQKIAARQLVLDLFAPQRWPGRLHMMTVPGIAWRFERLLLAEREPGWTRRKVRERTFFTSVENDRTVYYAALLHMPGIHTELSRIKFYPFAEMGIKTRFASFFFANLDDMMRYFLVTPPEEGRERRWHAAWFDYTGPLTPKRLDLIRQFYDRFISSTLVVTALKTRFGKPAMAAIDQAGSHSAWLRQNLPGEVLHEIDYRDTSPMTQFAVCKHAP